MLNSNDRHNSASPNESLPSKPVGRCEVCPAWQFSSITEPKWHVSILHLKYKKSSLPAKTKLTCKFKGCNMVFSSHHSLRNHVAGKDHYVRRRPNNNKKVDKAQQAKKRRKETTTSIVDFFYKASTAESVKETQSPNDQEDKWECKWCTEGLDDRMKTDGSFVITMVISITCNARGCSTRKTNIMISILKVRSFIVTNVNLDSEHFHC